MSELEQNKPSGVSRRTVTKAMAWAVPAIAIATAVPAFAASQGQVTVTGAGCKLPGNSQSVYKGYAFKASISNTTASAITITINSITLDGDPLGAFTVVNLDTCTVLGTSSFSVPANTTYPNIAIVTANDDNSSNGTLLVNYSVTGIPGTQTASATATGLPPIQGGSCDAFTNPQKTCIGTLGT